MDVRQFFFKNRSYTPIPLAFAIIFFADPSGSATIVGFLLVLVGEIIRLNGVHHAGGATRTRKVGAPALCTSGPFGHVRNPLYLGNIIIYAGVVLMAGGPFMWQLLGITVAFFFLQYGLIISLEEEILAGKFRDEYRLYLTTVPRFIPRTTSWSGHNKTSPLTWEKTFRTERRTFQMIAIFFLFIVAKATILR
jgi:protein-S-isoprenylcysteine O-methyltransferase Ste14